MKYKDRSRLLLVILVLLASTLVFVACSSGSADRIWLEAPDWSRAQIIGTSNVNDPASIIVDDLGTIYTFLIAGEEGISRPRIIALDPQAEVLWDQTFDVIIDRPDKPRLIWDGQSLVLFWLDSNSLYTAKLDPSGNVLEEPRLLSGEHNVESYSAAADPEGNISVWYAGSRRAPGLHALNLNSTEEEPKLVDLLGIRPSILFDLDGNLHASWGHHPPGFGDNKILYAFYPEGNYAFGQEVTLARPIMAPTSLLRGPFLGLDETLVTILWSVEVRTGMEAGRTDTSYVSFPLGQPELAGEPDTLFVPATLLDDYESVTGGELKAGSRIPLAPGEYAGTSSVGGIAINPVITEELVMAYESVLPHMWRKAASQISTLFMQDGTPTDYQLLSFTRTSSSAPAIVSDDDGYLYVTWVESAEEGFDVYLASTSPEIVDAIKSLTFGDLSRLTGETVFGVLGGVALSPITVLLWMIIPLFIIALTGALRRGNDSFSNPWTIASLSLAFIVYLLIKGGTVPQFLVYVPFSAWLPLPAWLKAPLQYLVPIGITLFALWATWYFVYRRGTQSLMFLTAIFIAIDGLLTMAVYGIIYLGAI